MHSRLALLSLAGMVLHTTAQCVTSSYVPCLAPDSQVEAPPDLTPLTVGGSGFWTSLSSAASDPILKRSLAGVSSSPANGDHVLEARQSSLCCRPAPVECLYTGDVPFCYVGAFAIDGRTDQLTLLPQDPDTTRVYFSDGSYGFISNDTFYGADGTFIDYQTGIYQYPDGQQVTFTPDATDTTSNSSSSSGLSKPTAASTTSVSSASSSSSPQTTTSSSSSASSSASTSPSSSSSSSAKGEATNASANNLALAMFAVVALSMIAMVL